MPTDFAQALVSDQPPGQSHLNGFGTVIPAKERHPVLDTGPVSSDRSGLIPCEYRANHRLWTPAFAGVTTLQFRMRLPWTNPPLTPSALPSKIEYMSNLADIIAQETQDGRLIVRFLLSAMDGDLPDFLPCHRIDAARLLVKLGFDQAQTVIDHARANRRAAAPRDSRSHPHAQPQAQPPDQSESHGPAHSIRAQLAQIVREETDDGYVVVQFLVNAMEGELPDFKPCHRLSAARELLQRGFDCLPDDAAVQAAAEPEPAEPTPEELEAQRRRAEDIEFSNHGPVYYESNPYPCVCEDRLHDCNGAVLDDPQRETAARNGPAMQYFISDADRIDNYLARYAGYLARRNAANPHNPIDVNRIHWTDPRWQHLNFSRAPDPNPHPS